MIFSKLAIEVNWNRKLETKNLSKMQTFALVLTACAAFSAVFAEVFYEEKFETGTYWRVRVNTPSNISSFFSNLDAQFLLTFIVLGCLFRWLKCPAEMCFNCNWCKEGVTLLFPYFPFVRRKLCSCFLFREQEQEWNKKEMKEEEISVQIGLEMGSF